jgi:hypothetical protein
MEQWPLRHQDRHDCTSRTNNHSAVSLDPKLTTKQKYNSPLGSRVMFPAAKVIVLYRFSLNSVGLTRKGGKPLTPLR